MKQSLTCRLTLFYSKAIVRTQPISVCFFCVVLGHFSHDLQRNHTLKRKNAKLNHKSVNFVMPGSLHISLWCGPIDTGVFDCGFLIKFCTKVKHWFSDILSSYKICFPLMFSQFFVVRWAEAVNTV